MSGGPPPGRQPPRHLAGASPGTAPPSDDTEVPPRVRVERSRLAFAIAVTLAALPLIALDNLSATAETDQTPTTVEATVRESRARLALVAPSTTASTVASTTTTAAPTTTEAPSTTAAPVVTVVRTTAPPTTAAPTTTQRPTTTSTTAPPGSGSGDPDNPATWEALAQCESGGNWSLNTGNGYYGGLQFSLATWQSVGGAGYPHQATKAEQILRGQILQARAGWGQWPHCANKLGFL